MNETLKLENFWISLFWIFTFMCVLPWDQEKIVVINLIIFCYFLYYMTSSSINMAFRQRRSLIKATLLQNLTLQLGGLRGAYQQLLVIVTSVSNLLLVTLHKLGFVNKTQFNSTSFIRLLLNPFLINWYMVNTSLKLLDEKSSWDSSIYSTMVLNASNLSTFELLDVTTLTSELSEN